MKKQKSKISKKKLCIVSAVIIVLLTSYLIIAFRKTGTFYPTAELFDGRPTFRFLDVGQGDCTLVTYKGYSVLIDAGPASVSGRTAEKVKTYAPDIDIFVITHPHEDHMGGAPEIFDSVKVETLILPYYACEEQFYITTLEKAEKQGTEIICVNAGSCIDFPNDAVFLTIIDSLGAETDDFNSLSLAVRIEAGEKSLLIAGDAETEEEEYILTNNDAEAIDTDYLKVSHHGSSTSTSAQFLEAVSPEICIISVGHANSYGHPSMDVINRITNYGAEIIRTDKKGDISLRG